MNFLEGIEFNIIQPVGVYVVAFAVKMTKFEQWKNLPLCTLEKLEYSENVIDGKVQRTFFIPYGEEFKDANILIASLTKNRCVIGYGRIKNNEFVAENETIQLEYMNYGESDVLARNFSFTYNPNRQIVLLDVQTGEQVMPTISKPDMFGNLKGTYKLIPYRKYIALEMNVMVTLPKDNFDNIAIEELADVIL